MLKGDQYITDDGIKMRMVSSKRDFTFNRMRFHMISAKMGSYKNEEVIRMYRQVQSSVNEIDATVMSYLHF